ncbi:MAG: hypothetical protein QOG05_469 [Streptosporangiaceae bacterium]|jgi:hypothetical protein|nr:hypothetical protein [Streptosporangiaceae bacterium]
MTGSGVQEIVTGVWCWQRRPRGLRPGEFGARTSYAVVVDGETLLVDPLVDGDDDPALGALDDLVRGRVRILISKPFHTRSAEPLWGRYRRAKARIYGHPEVATRLGDASGFEAVTSGHDVGGVARFHAIGRPPARSSRSRSSPAGPWSSATPSSRRVAVSCVCGRTRWTVSAVAAGGRSATCRRWSAWPLLRPGMSSSRTARPCSATARRHCAARLSVTLGSARSGEHRQPVRDHGPGGRGTSLKDPGPHSGRCRSRW